VVPVRNPDGSVCLCVDYRKVNVVTCPDPFYIPTLDEVIADVGSSCVVSRLDLTKGYYQVVVAPEDREKTAFRSEIGKYEFTRMLFGLRNAPAFVSAVEGVGAGVNI